MQKIPMLMTVEKVAEYLDVSRSTVYQLMKKDKNFPKPIRDSESFNCSRGWEISDLDKYKKKMNIKKRSLESREFLRLENKISSLETQVNDLQNIIKSLQSQ